MVNVVGYIKQFYYGSGKLRWENIIPTIHFILTFFFERLILIFENNWDIFLQEPRADSISNAAETIMVYVLSKIWALIIIFLLWKLIFAIRNKKISGEIISIFASIYIIGAIMGLLMFPGIVGLGIDNYVTYSYAIRFLPFYWHSIFTGALYAGCMMVLPHTFSIFLFQWLAFTVVIAYIYNGVKTIWNNTKLRFVILILFVLPETFYLIFNPYRNNYYTILCLFYIAYLVFAVRDKKDHNNLSEIIKIVVLSSFIMVWRSEGILIGLGGICFALLFIWRLSKRRLLALFLIFVCCFCCFNKCQGIGSEKYYGKDYQFINTLAPLCSILNNPKANLSYACAEDDLAALENVIPVDIIKQYAIRGYRDYNYTLGHIDFNQSLVDDETANAYMQAYYRIVLHNMKEYLDVQVNMLYASLQINCSHNTYKYSGENYVELQKFVYDFWRLGYDDIRKSFFTQDWEKNLVRVAVSNVLSNIMLIWRELWTATGLNPLLHVLVMLADIWILCLEFILTILEKDKKHFSWFILLLTVLGEMCVVALFMPEGRPAYMYPFLYTSYLLVFLYIGDNYYHNHIVNR